MSKQSFINKFLRLSSFEQEAVYENLYTVINQSPNILLTYLKDLRESKLSKKSHCPHCESARIKGHGRYKGRQRYKCKDCQKTFNDMTSTPIAGTHYPEKWDKHIQLMIEGKTLQQVSEELNIHISTAFYWRHKVLDAVKLLATTRLTDVIESNDMISLEPQSMTNQVANSDIENEFLYGLEKTIIAEKIYQLNTYYNNLRDLIKCKFRGVATKYIENYLNWLQLIEITHKIDKIPKSKLLY